MQKIWFVAFLAVITLVAFSCAPSRKAADISVGSWNYTVTGTPNGDVSGYFMITKEGVNYTGSINSNQGSIPFKTISIADRNLSATFDYSGYAARMNGTFQGNAFAGNVTVDNNDFPITASRRE